VGVERRDGALGAEDQCGAKRRHPTPRGPEDGGEWGGGRHNNTSELRSQKYILLIQGSDPTLDLYSITRSSDLEHR